MSVRTAKKTSKQSLNEERSSSVSVVVPHIPTPSLKATNCKHNKHFPLQKMSRTNMMNLIMKSNGRFITTTHVDANGDLRTMNITVKKGAELGPLGLLTVYSVRDGEYRNLNPQTLTELSINRIHYKTKI
jgi:hypothetical protein